MKNEEVKALVSSDGNHFFMIITLDDHKNEIYSLPLLKQIKLDHPEIILTEKISPHLTFVKVTHEMLGPWSFYVDLPDRYKDYQMASFFPRSYNASLNEEDVKILDQAQPIMDTLIFPQGPLSPLGESIHEIVKNHLGELEQQMLKFHGVYIGFEKDGSLFVGVEENSNLKTILTIDKKMLGSDKDLGLKTLEQVLLRNRIFVSGTTKVLVAN